MLIPWRNWGSGPPQKLCVQPQLEQAGENLREYVALAIRVFDRLELDPDAWARFDGRNPLLDFLIKQAERVYKICSSSEYTDGVVHLGILEPPWLFFYECAHRSRSSQGGTVSVAVCSAALMAACE